jgi:short-subunit dehydrogenase
MNVLITGGSSGIGRGIAEELAQQKHSLLLVARDAGRLATAADELRSKHSADVRTFVADVGDEAAVAKVRRYCEKQFVPNVLVLNAGVWVEGSVTTAKPKDIEALMKVNVYQAFHFAREFVPLLEGQQTPRIILTGSTAGIEAHPRAVSGLYSVTKWALHGVAVNLRGELKGKGIGVTHIAPGSVRTEMWDDEEVQEGRMLEPSDIGKLVATLLTLSPQADVEEIVVRPLRGNI